MLRFAALTMLAIALLFVQSAVADERASLEVAGATIAIEADDALKPAAAELQHWVDYSARAVARFYGRFPAKQLSLRLDARPGRGGVGGGVTTNTDGAEISIHVGAAVTREELAEDWVLVALFCFQADVSIREQSGNRYSLRDALIAILNATGGYAGPSAPRGVDINEVLRIGDHATHTSVLTDLYARMKDSPNAPDLDALWQRLGVRDGKDGIEFDDKAHLAAIRAAITKAR
jgi:hypothetical protein